MNKALPPINESTSELEDRLRHEKQPQRKERLLLLYLLKTAQARSRKAAATTIGRSRNTVARWLDLYEADGLEALLAVYEPTGQSGQRTLPREVFEALQAKLSDPEGFSGGNPTWSCRAGSWPSTTWRSTTSHCARWCAANSGPS